jgi:hypothetical protein
LTAHAAKAIVAAFVFSIFPLTCLPSAHADSFDLTSNNLGISGSVGTVTITDTGTNQVTIKITMGSGFSLKLPGGDIALSGLPG